MGAIAYPRREYLRILEKTREETQNGSLLDVYRIGCLWRCCGE
ncbi:hypothetical protein CKA32_005214 [Geitlerinema sp. FC II]|nr:hypothetical protein CKA32_005214 [Geitlerinema sp. FC II]